MNLKYLTVSDPFKGKMPWIYMPDQSLFLVFVLKDQVVSEATTFLFDEISFLREEDEAGALGLGVRDDIPVSSYPPYVRPCFSEDEMNNLKVILIKSQNKYNFR